MGAAESVQRTYTSGYHVLNVHSGSPGATAGLQSYFDVIVSANGTALDSEDSRFVDLLMQSVNAPVQLIIYNSKTETFRETTIIPNMNWGGQGVLGVSIRFCSLKGINEHVWHVLDVNRNSPASTAGLQAHTDYIVGALRAAFQDSDSFYNVIGSNYGVAVDLFVYNTTSDNVRLVSITPNPRWGGEGSLGCDVGYGMLHRIPTKKNAALPIAPGVESPQVQAVKQGVAGISLTDLPVPEALPSSVLEKAAPKQVTPAAAGTPVLAAPLAATTPVPTASTQSPYALKSPATPAAPGAYTPITPMAGSVAMPAITPTKADATPSAIAVPASSATPVAQAPSAATPVVSTPAAAPVAVTPAPATPGLPGTYALAGTPSAATPLKAAGVPAVVSTPVHPSVSTPAALAAPGTPSTPSVPFTTSPSGAMDINALKQKQQALAAQLAALRTQTN